MQSFTKKFLSAAQVTRMSAPLSNVDIHSQLEELMAPQQDKKTTDWPLWCQ